MVEPVRRARGRMRVPVKPGRGRRVRLAGLAVLASTGGAACTLEPAEGFELSMCFVADGDEACPELEGTEPVFYADGNTVARLLIEVPSGTTSGKRLTVTTSLGELRPSATDAAGKASRTVTTQGTAPLFVDLFVGAAPGRGVVTVESTDTSVGALSTAVPFLVERLTNTLTIEPPDEESLFADDFSRYPFMIFIETETAVEQEVTLSTSLGSVFPDKVLVAPGQPALVLLSAGTVAGDGVLTARLGAGQDQRAVAQPFELLASNDELTLEVEGGAHPADDRTIVPITVRLDSEILKERMVTVETSLGRLNPNGASDEAKRIRTVELGGGGTVSLSLEAGRRSGVGVLSAKLDGDGLVEQSFSLDYVPPTLLSLALTRTTLTATGTKSDVTAFFGRPAGQGRVSLGTQVEFRTCCDLLGDGGFVDCGELLSVPSFARAPDSGEDNVTTTVALTALGEAFVGEVGTPPVDELPATLFAFVFDPEGSGAEPGCAALASASERPLGLSAIDQADLVLRKQAP